MSCVLRGAMNSNYAAADSQSQYRLGKSNAVYTSKTMLGKIGRQTLITGATTLTMVFAVSCGAVTEVRRGSGGDSSGTGGASAGQVLPTAITVGAFRACALVSNGTVKCWGGKQATAAEIAGVTAAASVSCGETHCCAILNDGRVQCWGDNVSGELGDGTTSAVAFNAPTFVSGVSNAVSVAAGGQSTSAALADGTIVFWGNRTGAMAGVTSASNTLIPVAVPGISGVSAVTMTSSKAGGCLLLTDGSIDCWGPDSALLRHVYAADANPAKMVDAGFGFECALLSDDSVRCWGDNDMGQLGLGIESATQVATGHKHACAVLKDGTLRCWGSGYLGVTTNSLSTAPIVVPSISNAIAVDAGYDSTCLLLQSGTVQCWGSNGEHQLGDGTTTTRTEPTNVLGL